MEYQSEICDKNKSNEQNVNVNNNEKVEVDLQDNQPDRKIHYKPTKTKSYVKKNANSEQLDLEQLSHEQLLVEAKRLQSHLTQLKNIINKTNPSSGSQVAAQTNPTDSDETKKKPNKKVKVDRPFDFTKFNKRHVFLRFAYFGWNYQGYTIQEGIPNTVENHLFEAFKRTKLIESRETSNYHRCGRTDKGVSAFTQVISIDFRSNCATGEGVIVNESSNVKNTNIENEINYVKLLNGVLPDEIRAIGWCPVGAEVSARFDCIERIYRYFLPMGDLDIEAMRDAGKRLVGEKDFRNFCKMDVGNGVVTFLRRIDNITINVLDNEPNIYSTVEIIVEGSSFLWHQIRCIVAVLLLIGQRKESPSIVDDLLDIEKYPCKPQYTMCAEHPLVLFDCQYENIKWLYDRHELEKVIKHFQDQWLTHQTKASIVKRMIEHLEPTMTNLPVSSSHPDDATTTNKRTLSQPYSSLQGKSQSLTYVKFALRRQANSLEERVDHYIKKRRLDSDVYEKIADANSLAKVYNIYKPNSSSSSSS